MPSPARKEFAARVKKLPSGCWMWPTRSSSRRNYGTFAGIAAHRASYALHIGPIPSGLCVCHRCDNPGCVNPSHLFLGTHRDNMDDKLRKGREARKLSPAQVREVRALIATGEFLDTEIAKRFGVTSTSIGNLRRGRTFWDRQPSHAERRAAKVAWFNEWLSRQAAELAGLSASLETI